MTQARKKEMTANLKPYPTYKPSCVAWFDLADATLGQD